MPSPVPPSPHGLPLASMASGRNVSCSHGQSFALETAFRRGCDLPPIVSCYLPSTATNNVSYPVRYVRSAGCFALLVEMEFHGAAIGSQSGISIATAVSSGSVDWIGPTLLDGETIAVHNLNVREYPSYRGFLDVTGVALDTPVTITFTTSTPSGYNSNNGVYRLHICEVPSALLFPEEDADEPGFSIVWPQGGHQFDARLIDGSTGGFRGFLRLVDQIDQARYLPRRHIQLLRPERDANAWSRSAGSFANIMDTHKMRERRLYEDTVTNKYALEYRYKQTGGGTGRLQINTSMGSFESGDLTSSSYTYGTAITGVEFDTSLSGLLATFDIQAKTTAGTIYFDNFLLRETET